jgi:hypothetical protein
MYCWWGMEFNADSITGTSTALRLEFQPGLPPPALLIQMVGLGLLLGGGPTRRGAARGKLLRRRGGAILLPLRRPLFQPPPPANTPPGSQPRGHSSSLVARTKSSPYGCPMPTGLNMELPPRPFWLVPPTAVGDRPLFRGNAWAMCSTMRDFLRKSESPCETPIGLMTSQTEKVALKRQELARLPPPTC